MKKLISKLYIIGFMCLVLWFAYIIWHVTFGHVVEEYNARKIVVEVNKDNQPKKDTQTFQEAIIDGDERVKHYLGYRVLEQQKILGHFHHIDFDFKPDQKSYCVECHGDMPHDKVKELRAFGNMHASFVACQTCHVRFEGKDKTGVYKWYDRTTGEITNSPVQEGIQPGAYAAKIIPFERVDGELRRIDSQERIDFAHEYRRTQLTLNDIQKGKAKNLIHQIVSKKPHICEDCHQTEAPMISFKDLGYPEKRINAIVSTEVVGMIKNYTKFYMPRILHPGEEQ